MPHFKQTCLCYIVPPSLCVASALELMPSLHLACDELTAIARWQHGDRAENARLLAGHFGAKKSHNDRRLL